jgi:RNA recognition motif-containing protein
MATPEAQESGKTKRKSSKKEAESPTSKKRKSTLNEIEVDLEAPEPPSKKARRALKKGKTLPTKPGSDDEKDNDQPKHQEGDKASEMQVRSEHAIWVGNLPFTVTEAELRQWFIDNSGEVITEESITRVKLPSTESIGPDRTKRRTNKGFAYVDFDSLSSKVAAVALSETQLGTRRLLIKDSKSFEGRPAKEKAEADSNGATGKGAQHAEPQNTSRKIFVGNLGFKTDEDMLHQHFEKCGEIEWVKIATFEDTGKCKGFGWVKFKEPEAAAWAVKGFVKLKEEIETEEDFMDKSNEEEGGADGESQAEKREKKFHTRKWWLKKLLGRELKIELAEDDQLRYKKRFGKDARGKGQGEGRRRTDGVADDAGTPLETSSTLKTQEDLQVARLTGAAAKATGKKITFD